MNAILQGSTLLPPVALAEGRRRSSDARGRAVLAMAALHWAALAVAVLAFVAAGIAVWLG